MMSVADINRLRVLVRKASRPPAVTPAERAAKDKLKREAYKAEVLSYCQQQWDERYAELTERYPGICVELGMGFRPTEYSKSLTYIYDRRNNPLF